MNDSAVAAIKYALEKCDDCFDSVWFLRLWNEGDFEAIREEYEDVPDEVFIDADPLFKSPAHIEDGEGIDWSCLPSYLIDHYEGWSITEEGLQFAISEMLKDPDYLRVQAEKAALSGQRLTQLALPEGLEELLSDLLRCGMSGVVVNGESMRDRVAAMLKTVSRSSELSVPTIDIQHCVFIGKNADGSSPIDFEVGQLGLLKIGSLQSVKMHGWQCIGPLLSDEDKALIEPAKPAAGVPEGIPALASFVAFADTLKLNLRDRAELWDGAMALYRQLTTAPTPPQENDQ